MYQYGWGRDDIKFRPFAGISFSHLNRPNETFIIDGNKAPIKTSLYTGVGISVNDQISVTPSAMILRQDQFSENTFGASMAYELNNSNAIHFGLYNRMDDAIIAYAGYQLNQVMLGMSYDANTSELSKSGRTINAFEISLAWSPLPRKKPEPEFEPEEAPVTEMQLPMLEIALPLGTLPEMVMAERPDNTVQPVSEATNHEEEVIQESVKPVEAAPVQIAAVPAIEVAKAPVADSDGDGIEDAADACPYIRGSAVTGGCPDSDGDGVQDLKDKCPMEAGSAVTGGCPDASAPVAETQVLVKKFNNVLFEPGTSTLNTMDIYDIIERAIEVLYRDKNSKVILSGHTDNEGDAAVNMLLSQGRADAVKKYMVKMGVDPARISTVAYGENMPLESNSGNEGRRLNRRVEINIVKP
jgi:outer membrane protein OmpA-like peptidoglycan-associated protein